MFSNEAKGVCKHHEEIKSVVIQEAKDSGKKKNLHPDAIKAAMNRRYLALSLEEKKVYYLKAFPASNMETAMFPSALAPGARKIALAAVQACANVAAAAGQVAAAAASAAPAPEVVIQADIIEPGAVAQGPVVHGDVILAQ